MKYIVYFLISSILFFGQPVQAQTRSTPSSTPTTTAIFQKDNANQPIHFPNLIKRFQNGGGLEDFFAFALEIITTLGALLAFFYVLYGGFKYVTSGGNPSVADEGKKMVIGAIIGMLIIALAYVVVLFIRNSVVDSLGTAAPTTIINP